MRLIYQYIYVLRFKLFGDKHIKEIIVENRKFLLSRVLLLKIVSLKKMIMVCHNKYMKTLIVHTFFSNVYRSNTIVDKFLKKENLNYLEIGTSVLKNYFQIENYLITQIYLLTILIQ